MNASGGLQISGNTTAQNIAPGGTKITGWSAIAASSHGNLSVVPSTSNSRLTLAAGKYLVTANMTIETELVSGTSGDSVGILTGKIYKGGSAYAGSFAKVNFDAADRARTMHLSQIIIITPAEVAAGTNYVEVYLVPTDASGNDVSVSEAQFLAICLNG